jgi:hypothetical protein
MLRRIFAVSSMGLMLGGCSHLVGDDMSGPSFDQKAADDLPDCREGLAPTIRNGMVLLGCHLKTRIGPLGNG